MPRRGRRSRIRASRNHDARRGREARALAPRGGNVLYHAVDRLGARLIFLIAPSLHSPLLFSAPPRSLLSPIFARCLISLLLFSPRTAQGSDSCIALGSQLLEACTAQITALTPYIGEESLPPAIEESLPDPSEACCAAAASYVAEGNACQCSQNTFTHLLPEQGDINAQSVSEALSLLVETCQVAAAECS